nr:GH10845p [Drosophila melanogaster]
MRLLFNNYEHDTHVNEHVTPNERKEENDFLDAVMATPVMRQAMLFLQQKGVVSPDPKTHRDLVKELWFTQYSRGQGKIGSSGFEHVFVYEVKDGTIIGFHNWVYIGDEEKDGRFDYKGYMKEQDIGTKGKIVKIRFSHQGLNKPVNTVFVGTSPELELALYTVCFQLRPDRTCPVSLGNSKFGIVTYSWRYRGKNLIGSAYPEI